ncbi:MAG TPA: hypothetical protein VKN73_04390 [Desulfosalsimonadaceae bacterium]|nr:hypothetical protein [Desulfosalsimonadaceae bacterium]
MKKQQAAGRFKSDCLLTRREKEVVNAPIIYNASPIPNCQFELIIGSSKVDSGTEKKKVQDRGAQTPRNAAQQRYWTFCEAVN